MSGRWIPPAKAVADKMRGAGNSVRNAVDLKRVKVQGGQGGFGRTSYRRDRSGRGPPDGGDGGRGGDVIIVACRKTLSLASIPSDIRAANGQSGGANQCSGADGEPYILRVPLGTAVWKNEDIDHTITEPEDFSSSSEMRTSSTSEIDPEEEYRGEIAEENIKSDVGGLEKTQGHMPDLDNQEEDMNDIPLVDGMGSDPFSLDDDEKMQRDKRAQKRMPFFPNALKSRRIHLLTDLETEGAELLLVRGGDGGFGNQHEPPPPKVPKGASEEQRRRDEKAWERRMEQSHEQRIGKAGESARLFLEMRTIADVGLIGFPNAGKSTLLAGLTNATPKIAPYAFTTLGPQVGTVMFDDYERFTIADIPGIIEGAHENRGLGFDFLRHIVRTRVLCFVLDMGRRNVTQPVDEFNQLLLELESFQDGLAMRPAVIVANKMDNEFASSCLHYFKDEISNSQDPLPVFPVSASQSKGLEDLVYHLRNLTIPN